MGATPAAFPCREPPWGKVGRLSGCYYDTAQGAPASLCAHSHGRIWSVTALTLVPGCRFLAPVCLAYSLPAMRDRDRKAEPGWLKGALNRKTCYLYDDESAALAAAAADARASEAEIIRRAIRRYLKIGKAPR